MSMEDVEEERGRSEGKYEGGITFKSVPAVVDLVWYEGRKICTCATPQLSEDGETDLKAGDVVRKDEGGPLPAFELCLVDVW